MGDYDLTDEKQVQEYLQNIETEYSFQCMSEKDPEGCFRLADFLFSIKQKDELGSKLFRKNCDEMNHAGSCFKHAGMVAMGKGGTFGGLSDSVKYFTKACDLGMYRGCANAGMMCLRGFKAQQDTDKGLELLHRACANGRGEACSLLGESYRAASNNLPKDTSKAVSFFTKGCELDDGLACHNLARMYKLGDGVDKDSKLASEYAEKTRKIRAQMTGKDSVNVSIGRRE